MSTGGDQGQSEDIYVAQSSMLRLLPLNGRGIVTADVIRNTSCDRGGDVMSEPVRLFTRQSVGQAKGQICA